MAINGSAFFWRSPQGTAPDTTGYKGFYYHFLDMTTGARAGQCELSTVDTSFFSRWHVRRVERIASANDLQ